MSDGSSLPLKKQLFYFIRHAETDWNTQKLCQGWRDIPLNESGLLAAKAFALSTKNYKIPCIVSSSLTRALQTAKEIHEVHPDVALHVIPELRERCWGSLEGASSEEMYAIEKLEDADPFFHPGKGVESRSDFRKRLLKGIALSLEIDPHPWIVSHGRLFMELCFALNISPLNQLLNCQLVEIAPDKDGWKMTNVIC